MHTLKRKRGPAPQTGRLPLSFGTVPRGPAPGPVCASSLWACVYLADEPTAAGLRTLADWAYGYSADVVIEPPQALLIEVGASLKLFGGLDALRQHLQQALAERSLPATLAISPTPRGSLWLARYGQSPTLTNLPSLRAALARLPACTPDEALAPAFWRLGLRTLADVWRLPREGLARRFGRSLLTQIDQALDQVPQAQRLHQPEPRYRVAQDVPDLQAQEQLLAALAPLLEALVDKLRMRDRAMGRLHVRFLHERGAATDLDIGLRCAGRDAVQLLALAKSRLERTQIPSPVIRLRLAALDVEPYAPADSSLFGGMQPSQAMHWDETLERLEARLGAQALQGLSALDDHRPEHAWDARPLSRDPDAGGADGALAERPLWLLPEPKPLTQAPAPHAQAGGYTLISRAERIEGGWWMNADLRRDYYVARTLSGSRLWVYRDAQGGWYLHGYFA